MSSYCHFIYEGWYYIGFRAGINISSFDINNKFVTDNSLPLSETNIYLLTQEAVTKMNLRSVETTIDGRFGFLLNKHTLLFGLAGIAWNRTHLKVKTTGEADVEEDEIDNFQLHSSATFKTDRENVFFHWGVGVEQYLCQNISLEVLYTHTDYGDLFAEVSDEQTERDNITLTQSHSSEANFNRHTLSIGLLYHF